MSSVFLKIINMSITASWLIIAAILARLVLKRAPRWIACALWGLVAVRLVCPFSIESAISLVPAKETVPYDIALAARPAIDSGISALNEAINPVIEHSFTPSPGSSVNPLQVFIPIAAAIWLAGAAIMLIYALVSYLRLRRTVSASVLLEGGVMACDELRSPFILGLFRPRIYVPSSLSGESLDCVLKHERAHLARRDHVWKPLGFLILSVYWFNPLCWAAYILLCRDVESACDEKVVKDMDRESVATYSQALLDCASPKKRIAACPLAFGEVGVKGRIKGVLSYKKPSFWIIIAALAACGLLAVFLMTDPFGEKLDGKLSVSMDMAIAERNRGKGVEGSFAASDYDVLKIRRQGSSTTVYAIVMYEEFSLDGETIKTVSGSYGPAAITFDTRESGGSSTYEVLSYWEPRDGGYYADDIRSVFPASICGKALDVTGAERLHQMCLDKARAYYNENPGAAEPETPGTEPETEAAQLSVEAKVAYANYANAFLIGKESLDPDYVFRDDFLHVPVFVFRTMSDADSFREKFADKLTFTFGYDEVPSFDEATANWNDAFFAGHTVVLAYVSAYSGSFRFAIRDVYHDAETLALEIERTNDPESFTDDEAGWFIIAEVENEGIDGITKFEAWYVN